MANRGARPRKNPNTTPSTSEGSVTNRASGSAARAADGAGEDEREADASERRGGGGDGDVARALFFGGIGKGTRASEEASELQECGAVPRVLLMTSFVVLLGALVSLCIAQTSVGAPFNNPAFATAFDANNALITLTFANPISYVML